MSLNRAVATTTAASAVARSIKTTLFVATRVDAASVNIFHNLMLQPVWSEIKPPPPAAANDDGGGDGGSHVEGEDVVMQSHNARGQKFFLWLQSEPLLRLDNPDRIFQSRFEHQIDDVIFLSKHKAASGTRSLTVHPIGIPWQEDSESSGGVAGRCVPPHIQISGLYRRIYAEVKAMGLTERFQVTMEATHHGPFAEVPCCFVEIGSTEPDWNDLQAGEIWGKCIREHFCLKLEERNIERTTFNDMEAEYVEGVSYTILSIGGGHYVPRANDVARLGENIYIGHSLASYTLADSLGDGEETDEGDESSARRRDRWQHIISEAIESTRISIAYTASELVCLVDKKAFKAKARTAITDYLDSLAIKWVFSSADIKKLVSKG